MTDKKTDRNFSEERRAVPETSDTSDTSQNKEVSPDKLTPEEQMARYEESLKEDDWGHQPC